jgi:hypothetical protein
VFCRSPDPTTAERRFSLRSNKAVNAVVAGVIAVDAESYDRAEQRFRQHLRSVGKSVVRRAREAGLGNLSSAVALMVGRH